MSDKVSDLSAASFEATIKDSKVPVAVDFWAPWCGPCKAMAPILDELAEELEGKAIIAKVNVDEHSDIASRFSVRAVPTIVLFKGGEAKDQVVGLVNKDDLKAKLEAL